MQFPNVASLALIAALIAALEFIAAGAEDVSTALWVPAAVLVLGAAAKALEVYLQRAEGDVRTMDAPQSSALRRWLLE